MSRWTVSSARRLARVAALPAGAVAALAAGPAPTHAFSSRPDLAVDGAGNTSFVWQEHDGGTTSWIQERRRSAAGTLTDVQTLSSGSDQIEAHVAVAPDGTATFVWTGQDGFRRSVQTRSRAPDGTLSAVQNLSAAGQNAQQPGVAVDPDGNANFVWRRSNGTHDIIQARRRFANGTLEAAQSISAVGQDAFGPRVAVDPDGNASFVWRSSDGSGAIVQARRRLANGTFEATQKLYDTAGDAFPYPTVAVDLNGNATFAWTGFNAGHFTVQTRRKPANGRLEATQNVSAPGQDASGAVEVAPDGTATFVMQRSNGTHYIVQTRRRLANGTFEATHNLSAAGQHAGSGTVAFAPDGSASFAWVRLNGTHYIVQTRRRLANGTFDMTQNVSAAGANADANAFGPKVVVGQAGTVDFVWWLRSNVVQTRRRTSSGFGPIRDLAD